MIQKTEKYRSSLKENLLVRIQLRELLRHYHPLFVIAIIPVDLSDTTYNDKL